MPRLRRRRRLRRPLFLALGLLAIVMVAGLFVLHSSWFISGRVEGALSRLLGGPVRVEHGRYAGEGRFILRGVELRAPGVPGPPGRLATIDRAVIIVDEARLYRGEVVPRQVLIDRLRLRLSEDIEEHGQFTFAALRPSWSSTGDDRPPALTIDELGVEVGMHDGTSFMPSATRTFTATLRPAVADRGRDGWQAVQLHELGATDRAAGERLVVNGEWNVATMNAVLRVEALTFDDRTLAVCPRVVHGVLDRMELTGQVRDLEIRRTGAEFTVGFSVKQAAMRLPIDAGIGWVRYRSGTVEPVEPRPRLLVDRGRFEFDGDELRIDGLQGRMDPSDDADDVVGVPYEISLRLRELDPLSWDAREQWVDQLLQVAPFDISFAARDLRVAETTGTGGAVTGSEAVELPAAVAGVLKDFVLDRWTLTTSINVSRGAPSFAADGTLTAAPLETRGSASIADASGAYARFPYHLDDLQASLVFDQNRVSISNVSGVGSNGATVRLRGFVAPPTIDPAVELRLVADAVPVDDRLRDAFQGEVGDVLDRIRDDRCIDVLRANGLPLTKAQATGGTVDLDLRIQRDAGPDRPTVTTGDIDLHDVGLVLRDFPYPMVIERGALVLERDGLSTRAADPIGGAATTPSDAAAAAPAAASMTPDGIDGPPRPAALDGAGPLLVRTAGGGLGTLEGRITWASSDDAGEIAADGGADDPERGADDGAASGTADARVDASDASEAREADDGAMGGARPHILLQIEGDAIGPLLCAALPPSGEELDGQEHWPDWPGGRPSRAGAWLLDLGVAGLLDYDVLVGPDADGGITYRADVELRGVRADAAAAIRRATQAPAESPMRGDWTIDAAFGRVTVTPDLLRVSALAGVTSGGTVNLDGEVELGDAARSTELTLRAEGLRIEDHLHDVLPASARTRTEALLGDHDPSGTVDAEVVIASRGTGDATVTGALSPLELELTLEGRAVAFSGEDGQVSFAFGAGVPARIAVDDLALNFIEPDGRAGRLVLNGLAAWDDDADADGAVAADDPARAGKRAGTIPDTDTDADAAADAANAPDLRLELAWPDARLRSPLLASMMRWVGAENQLERLRDVEAAGSIGLGIQLQTLADGTRDWRIETAPYQVSFRVNDTPMFLELERGSEIAFSPGRIEIDGLRGGNGTVQFDAEGEVRTDRGIDARLRLDLEGQLLGPQISAFLPRAVRRTLEGLSLQESQPSRLSNVVIRAWADDPPDRGDVIEDLAAPGDAPPTPPPGSAADDTKPAPDATLDLLDRDWAIDFAGRIELTEASLEAGLLFGEITGPFDVTVTRRPETPLDVRIDAMPSRLTLLGQTVENLAARIEFDERSREVHVRDLKGDVGDGRITATAMVPLDSDTTWHATVQAAAVPIAAFELLDPEAEDGTSRREIGGDLFARLDLQGGRDDPATRVGRGTARILDADLFSIPSVLSFLQLAQLTPPAERYDYASADFFLVGDQVHVEELYLEATIGGRNAHSLTARGTLDLETKGIRGRIRSRSGIIAPLRDFVGSVGDMFAAIELGGTVMDPQVNLVVPSGGRNDPERMTAPPLLRDRWGTASVTRAPEATDPVGTPR